MACGRPADPRLWTLAGSSPRPMKPLVGQSTGPQHSAADMNDYPENFDEVHLDAVALSAEVVLAARRFAAARPWHGTVEERKVKFRTAIRDVCVAAGARPPHVMFDVDEWADSGRSCYIPALRTIILRGRLSVITAVHETFHLIRGPPERTAVAMSLALFRAAFPRSFARLMFRGQMAVAQRKPRRS